jgi:hypothetical protein
MTENQERHKKNGGEPVIGGGYPLFQLSKALTTAAQHPDPETRQRAQRRAESWAQVFEQIVNGSLKVGSRTPLDGIPDWVTLKVLTGGFASGELLADGPLEPHEQALLEKLALVSDENARLALNSHYLTDAGLAELQEMLQSGLYEINLPEEGALLVVAWLAGKGQIETAQQLLETLGPWFARLRFYPLPSPAVRLSGSRVCVQNVGETIVKLESIEPNRNILVQKETVCVWTPLYDQMIQLFLETVSGELPSLQCEADGYWTRSDSGKFPVQGGWPCQHYPAGWTERAARLLKACETARATHRLSQRPAREERQFALLLGFLQRCVQDPASLQGREVGRIRQILACYVTKRGTPDSTHCQALRAQQVRHASAPTYKQIAGILVPRLQAFPREAGLENPALIVQPVSDVESADYQLPAGTPIPETLQRRVERCLYDAVEVLVEHGLITSTDTLAVLLPQMTADIRAVGFSDPVLRRLYAGVYAAFRRRRSLLLLNLEHQVQLEELPWVAVLEQFRQADLSGKDAARQALQEVSLLALTAFPHAILPNKLLQELGALAKTAELDLPLVEEVAADIFMGQFSGKFLQAAHRAAGLLEQSLYAAYYDIDYRQLPELQPKPRPRLMFFKPAVSDNAFAELCAHRAGVSLGGWGASKNGMIIEQQQILTTQNLAVLFIEFQLAALLGDQLETMAQHCFEWICRRLQIKTDGWHARLIHVKNSAYAWRQMLFFLSLLSATRQINFLFWAENHLQSQTRDFQNRFRPALAGLAFAMKGYSLNSPDAYKAGVKRFLGWSKNKHWLMGGTE